MDRTSAGEKQRLRTRIENEESSASSLVTLLDATRGKSGSDERDRWKTDVIESVVDLIASVSLEQVKLVDENTNAIFEATTTSASANISMVTEHLSDSIAQLQKLQSEHRIEIDGIESRRRECIELFNERDAKLVGIADSIQKCETAAKKFTEANVEFFLTNSGALNVADTQYKDIAGRNAGKESMDARVKQLKAERLVMYGAFVSDKGGSKGKDVKTLNQLLPTGIEKSSGHQIGVAIKQFCRNRMETYASIIHIIIRIVDDFDTKTKEHWMGPCSKENGKSPNVRHSWTGDDGYIVNPVCINDISHASLALYDAFRTVVDADLLERLTMSNERGLYSLTEDTYSVPKGDGIMLAFALMTRFHDVHSDHIQTVIANMHNSWVHFAKGNVVEACLKVRKLIVECIELGISMEWHLTGRRIIQMLTSRNAGVASDVRDMMKGPTTDPTSPTSECLNQLEELCTKIERSVSGMQHDLPPAPKSTYQAFMGRLTMTEAKMLEDTKLIDRIVETKDRIVMSKNDKKRHRKQSAQMTVMSANNIQPSDNDKCQVVGCSHSAPGRTSFCDPCFNHYRGTTHDIKMKNGSVRTLEHSGKKSDGKGKDKGGKGKGKGKGKGGKGGRSAHAPKGHIVMSARDITDIVSLTRKGWKGSDAEDADADLYDSASEEEPEPPPKKKKGDSTSLRVVRLQKKLEKSGHASAARSIGKLRGGP